MKIVTQSEYHALYISMWMIHSMVLPPGRDGDYYLVIHMIGQTGVYFKGCPLAMGMYFQVKSLATDVKLLYFP